ncbi:MAG: sensor histidine kinase [Archangiaceae bacterium]|nr:sensor histidine kinase [Archangiaceae bacterium]
MSDELERTSEMKGRFGILGRVEPWLRGIALVIWAFIGVTRFEPKAWVLPFAAYGALMVLGGYRDRFSTRFNLGLLVLQSVSVLALPRLGLPGFEGMLLSFVVVQLPAVISLRASALWLVAQLVVLWPIVWPFNTLTQMFELTGAYSGFSTFALLVHWARLQERRARAELARSNAALLATRALLVEGSRQAERLRISRELHDSLGHHLAALSLQLDLAQRQTTGKPAEALARARNISQSSLAEVRKVVAEMQTEAGVDLVPALKALAAGVPSPHIEIRAPDGLNITGGEASHALFRCVQEAITNAVKHAAAKHVWVDLSVDAGTLRITVRDDGGGAREVQPGRGLTGMKARLADLGGDARFRSTVGAGFEVQVTLPMETTT